jgi:hypothetical protein
MTNANRRIALTPLSIDVRGTSVRVVVAADKYTVANVSEGMNDRREYARLFAAAPMLLEAIEQWPELDDPDMDLSGADLLDWFAQWRERAKEALR